MGGDLTSAALPPIGADDHLRGPADGELLVVYADFECAYCAVVEAALRRRDDLRVCFRHFPVKAKHPRAWPAAAAAEAAARQATFWPMHDALFDDQGRLEDPHLWARAGRLDLDVERFAADQRSPEVLDRVRRDLRAGMRAGVISTPALFRADGTPVPRSALPPA